MIINAGKDTRKGDLSDSAVGTVIDSATMEVNRDSSYKLKSGLPYGLAIPRLHVSSNNPRSAHHRHTCSMLSVALFKIART